MRNRMILCLALCALPVAIAPAVASGGEKLSGEEIRQMVTTNRVFLATPLGGEFPLNYRPNGQVDGSGEAIGLGRFVQPKDSGRWWIAGNALCQQWQTWYDGKRICFTIQRTGPKTIIWRQDSGDSGTARLAVR
jgi:hypothetical protein